MFLKGRHPERQTSNLTLLQVGCVLQSCKVFAQYHIPETLRQGLKLGIASRNLSRSKLHDLDVGTCWRWLPKYPPHHPYQTSPVKGEFLLPSSQLFSAKTPPRRPFCWRPRYPRWWPSSYPRPSSCPYPSSWGGDLRETQDIARPFLFSKMIKGGKWNRILKCTKTWRAHIFLHSLSGPSGWGI